MRYAIRSLKYFVYICLLLAVIVAALVALDIVEADIDKMFRHGSNSIWMMAGMFAVISCIYPLFGYTKRQVYVQGLDIESLKGPAVKFMEEKGYEVERQTNGELTFRQKKISAKITRMWEDRITINEKDGGIWAEGLRKDVVRLVMGLEHKLQTENPD